MDEELNLSSDIKKIVKKVDISPSVDSDSSSPQAEGNAALHFDQLMWQCNLVNFEAAEILGVSERTIYRWLSGKGKVPKTAIITLEGLLKKRSSVKRDCK